MNLIYLLLSPLLSNVKQLYGGLNLCMLGVILLMVILGGLKQIFPLPSPYIQSVATYKAINYR